MSDKLKALITLPKYFFENLFWLLLKLEIFQQLKKFCQDSTKNHQTIEEHDVDLYKESRKLLNEKLEIIRQNIAILESKNSPVVRKSVRDRMKRSQQTLSC